MARPVISPMDTKYVPEGLARSVDGKKVTISPNDGTKYTSDWPGLVKPPISSMDSK